MASPLLPMRSTRASATGLSAPAAAWANSGRLARYAAAVNACATDIYCRLAQACDLAANVILVAIGDALGQAGIIRSGAILQVTSATLESRRNGVVEALRSLLAPNAIDDQNTLPRAQQAVLEIYEALEEV